MNMTVQLTGSGLLGFPRTMKAMPTHAKAALKVAMNDTAVDVANEAKRRVAISSGGPRSRKSLSRPGPGELRATIRAEPSKTPEPVAYVKAGHGKLRRRSTARDPGKRKAPASTGLGVYAMVVEYGSPHRGVPAQPYLRPAREAKKGVLKVRAEQALNDAIRRSGG